MTRSRKKMEQEPKPSVDADNTCLWGCYDCGARWHSDAKYSFSYCSECAGGDTGVLLDNGQWWRFSQFNWDRDGKAPKMKVENE